MPDLDRGPTGAEAASGEQDDASVVRPLDDFESGFLTGVLVGEGHFGGDGRQAQITLRMHTDHEALFRWLAERIPGSRLYGPYHHGGRSYYQWMVRGRALRETVVPLLEARLTSTLDERAWRRFQQMRSDYRV